METPSEELDVINQTLLSRAVELTELDASAPRTLIQEDVLMDAYVAEFVSESESLEGNDSTPAEVLDASRELVGGV